MRTSTPIKPPRPAGPPPWVNRMVLAALRSPAGRLIGGGLCELRYTTRSGRPVTLPVQAAADGDRVVVLVAQAGAKRWWRAFRTPWPVQIVHRGQTRTGLGRVLTPGDDGFTAAAHAYRAARRTSGGPGDFVLVVEAPTGAQPDPPRARRVR